MSANFQPEGDGSLTKAHSPNQELPEFFGDIKFLNPESLQVLAQNVGQTGHFDAAHRIEHGSCRRDTSLDALKPQCLLLHDHTRCDN